MFGWLRTLRTGQRGKRQPVRPHGLTARGHPTPAQAFDALNDARCMYAAISTCSGKPRSTGLRAEGDTSDVLVCKAHYGRLRKLPARDAERLERELQSAQPPRVGDLAVTGSAARIG